MKCPQVQDRLSAFQDGELHSQEQERVSRHLESCSACRERYTEMEKVWQALGDLKEILPEPGFYGLLVEKINESGEARIRAGFQWFFQFFSSSWAAFALLFVGILTGTLLGNIAVKDDLLPFWQNQRTHSQAAVEVFSLKAFDPIPPGTLGGRYLQIANYEGEGR
jgi:anti-sigma factor RsiW